MKKITLLFVILLIAMMASVSKVSAQTQLTTPTVGIATLITAVGFTANWTPGDANALSFDIKVYDATPTLIKTVNVTGAATATAAITGLLVSTAYTFTVTAKGDGTIFTNSLESSPASVSTVAFITLATPTVGTASRVTLTNFVANWTPVDNATSYDINVNDASNALVAGFPKNITGATTQTFVITSTGGILLPNTTYTFTVTAKGDAISYSNSSESAKSSSFTTATSGSFLLQYADVDAMTLNADIKAGAADIYELTTSGGNYTFNTGSTSNNNTMIRSTTIRALAGLATKPIVKVISTTTGSTPNLFYTNTPSITTRFDGLELSGLNTSSGASQLMLFLAGPLATNCSVYVTNCFLHDFLNGAGNGIMRIDGTTGGLIDIQGSTFNNFGGRAFYLNGSSITTVVNLKNNTFTTNSLLSSRANIIYSTTGSGLWSGTISINHCTFNNIVTTSTSEGMIRQLTPATGGTITNTNSIFTAVGQTLYTYVKADYCYLTGFVTLPVGATATPVTNTFAATPVPAYIDVATNNFRLTNASSFICADGFIAGNTYNILAVPSVTAGGNNVTSGGFTANWTAVANASSYDMKVYDASLTQVGSTTNVPAENTSLVVTGLNSNANYTYTVTAIGDQVNYFNSPASVASASISTLVTGINSLNSQLNIFASNKEIISSETGDINVYNLQGEHLLEAKNVSRVYTSLSTGLYIVNFTNNVGNKTITKITIK